MKRWTLIPIIFILLGVPAHRSRAQDASVGLRQEVADAPNSAPSIITRALKGAGPNAPLLAAPATVAAIKGLGSDTTKKQVAAVVYAAVRAVPNSALVIVRAAVATAPNAAPEIAAAAVRAVPNPWKEVRYQREAPTDTVVQNTGVPAANREPDFKSTVAPATANAPLPVFDQPNAPLPVFDQPAAGDPMSLAEAIVQTAANTGGSNMALVQGAVDVALYGDPAALFSAVGGSRGISGVGDAGNSNYANEPHDPGAPSTIGDLARRKIAPANPPATPNPPVVSP